MTNRLMISVAAAALIAGTGFANAQGTGMSREAPPAAAPAQQSAPTSERGESDRGTAAGETKRDAAKPGMKSTQTEPKSPAAGKNQRADEGMQGQKSKMDEKPDQKSKTLSSDTDNNAKGGKDMKAEGQDRKNADSKGGAEGKTVGQAGAGGKLSTEQRTKITTVIKQQNIAPVTNVNFSISVGTRVPRDVSFHPLPAEIVTVYPDWRGYQFILVRNQIVVIDPQSLEIVAVLDA
jgi:opacity protein-like surface antigen